MNEDVRVTCTTATRVHRGAPPMPRLGEIVVDRLKYTTRNKNVEQGAPESVIRARWH